MLARSPTRCLRRHLLACLPQRSRWGRHNHTLHTYPTIVAGDEQQVAKGSPAPLRARNSAVPAVSPRAAFISHAAGRSDMAPRGRGGRVEGQSVHKRISGALPRLALSLRASPVSTPALAWQVNTTLFDFLPPHHFLLTEERPAALRTGDAHTAALNLPALIKHAGCTGPHAHQSAAMPRTLLNNCLQPPYRPCLGCLSLPSWEVHSCTCLCLHAFLRQISGMPARSWLAPSVLSPLVFSFSVYVAFCLFNNLLSSYLGCPISIALRGCENALRAAHEKTAPAYPYKRSAKRAHSTRWRALIAHTATRTTTHLHRAA